MNIKYKVPKEYINRGIIDLKKNFKIKLSNSDINIGKGALAINKKGNKYFIEFIIYDNFGNIMHKKELIDHYDMMTKSEFNEAFIDNKNSSLQKLFSYLYTEEFDPKDFKVNNIVNYHYDDALILSYANQFNNDEAKDIYEKISDLMKD